MILDALNHQDQMVAVVTVVTNQHAIMQLFKMYQFQVTVLQIKVQEIMMVIVIGVIVMQMM